MQPKTRLALETALAVIFAVIFVATVFWPDWIELVFGENPDAGSGQFEWAIVAISGVLAVGSIIAARMRMAPPTSARCHDHPPLTNPR